jgi:hypothetical protein
MKKKLLNNENQDWLFKIFSHIQKIGEPVNKEFSTPNVLELIIKY